MADGNDDVIVDLDTHGAPAEADVVEGPGDAGAAPATALPPNAVLQEDGSVRLTLQHPVTLRIRRGGPHGEVQTELTAELVLHRLTGADMRAIASAGKSAGVVGIARSARIAQHRFDAIYDRMDGADIVAADQVVDFFLGAGRTNGR